MAPLWFRSSSALPGPDRSQPVVHLAKRHNRWDELRPDACDRGDLDLRHELVGFSFELAELLRSEDWTYVRCLTRRLKRLRRCYPEAANEALAQLKTDLPRPQHLDFIEKNHITPFGGYQGACPKWSGQLRYFFFLLGARFRHLPNSAAPDVKYLKSFAVDYEDGKGHREAAKSVVGANGAIFRDVDIVGFTGHHYTSHLVPGWFTDIETSNGTDLRYVLDAHPNGFPNIKLVMATGCSLICTEALEILQPLFPKAVFIGQQNTMPLTGGEATLKALRKAFDNAGNPALLLDNTADFDFLITRWEEATAASLGHSVSSTGPGSARGDRVRIVVDHERGATTELNASDEANRCQRKADDRGFYLGP